VYLLGYKHILKQVDYAQNKVAWEFLNIQITLVLRACR